MWCETSSFASAEGELNHSRVSLVEVQPENYVLLSDNSDQVRLPLESGSHGVIYCASSRSLNRRNIWVGGLAATSDNFDISCNLAFASDLLWPGFGNCILFPLAPRSLPKPFIHSFEHPVLLCFLIFVQELDIAVLLF